MHPRAQYVATIEKLLTPKQHVLRWIDNVRRFRRYGDYCEDQLHKRSDARDHAVMMRAISEAVDRRMARADQKDHRREHKKAIRDAAFLRYLVREFNDTLDRFLMAACPEGAALARRLEGVIARVEIASDAERAVALLERHRVADTPKGVERRAAERRTVIARLDIYCLRAAEDDAPVGSRRALRQLSLLALLEEIREIRAATVALLRRLYTHQSGGDAIARTYLAGHPILYPENERRLTRASKWVEVVAGEYNPFVRHRIPHLIDEEPEIARAVTSAGSKQDWCIDLARVREDAAALCPELLAQSKRTALGLALLAIGEKAEGVRLFVPDAPQAESASVDDLSREIVRIVEEAQLPCRT